MKYNKIIRLATILKNAAAEELSVVEFTDPAQLANPEEKAPDQVMNDALIDEINKTNSLEVLGKIANMKQKKYAIPAMRRFVDIAEAKQAPMYDYARDMLYGRIPEHVEEFGKYKTLKRDFNAMSEEDVKKDPYNTVAALFTLWNKALNRAQSRKFRGHKGHGRGRAFDAPTSLTREQGKYNPTKPEQSEPVFTSPVGEYTSNISNQEKPDYLKR